MDEKQGPPMSAADFDRIADNADARGELYKRMGLNRSAKAAAASAEKARSAASCRRT